MAQPLQACVVLLVATAASAGESPRLRGLAVVASSEDAGTTGALAAPTLAPAANAWWQTPQLQASETQCLMDHRFGCYVIKHRETCLGSKDGRPNVTFHDLKIHGQPCVWCGGMACHDRGHTLCEPLDFLMHGEGRAFGTFYAKRTYQVAKCQDSEPLEYQPVYRTPAPPVIPTLPPWWVPERPEDLTCLKSYASGCNQIKHMGLCLTSVDGRDTEKLGGLRVKGEPCVWCGGGACHSNSSSLCEPFDWLMHGEGNNFGLFYAKMNFQVAGCSHKRTFHLPEGVDFSCLAEDEQGCQTNTDAVSCLSSKDGRDDAHIAGLRVKGQPCVWCGGGACHNGNWNKCEPFDYALNGQGQAFDYFHAKLTWRMGGCKNGKAAAMTLDAFEDTVGGYAPPTGGLGAGPAELVPFWVPLKPGANETKCLRRHAAGCSDITDMATCMTSRDGSGTPQIAGLKVAGEPCVWCGGAPCTTNSSSLCGPFDLLMYGEGKVFSSFSGKGVYKVADCTKGSVARPDYDYSCLSSTDQTKGCAGIGDAETCLASRDGRSGNIGPLAVGGEPCVWCGGGPCHTASSAKCEAFDFALNGESVAFATFHAVGSFRLAACKDGKPTAATLTNFTSFVPGYTFKPLPPPKVPVFNASWWKSSPPDASELSCLMDHKFGCNVVRHRETCLGSKDGRQQTAFGGNIKVHGQPCVWCGGGTCTSSSASVCEPFDLLMNGEGVNFTSFYAKNGYQVARCKDGKPLPPAMTPTLSPWLMVPLGSKAAQVITPPLADSSTRNGTARSAAVGTGLLPAGIAALGTASVGAAASHEDNSVATSVTGTLLPSLPKGPLPLPGLLSVGGTTAPAAAADVRIAAPLATIAVTADLGAASSGTVAPGDSTALPGMSLPTLPPLSATLPPLPDLPASITVAVVGSSSTPPAASAPASTTMAAVRLLEEPIGGALPTGAPAELPTASELPPTLPPAQGNPVESSSASAGADSTTAAPALPGTVASVASTIAPGVLPGTGPTVAPVVPPAEWSVTLPALPETTTPATAAAAATLPPAELPQGSATLAPLPTMPGLPAMSTTAPDADCWDACGNNGFCDFCGPGKACCRRAWVNSPACNGATGYTTWHHQCVPTSATQTTMSPVAVFTVEATTPGVSPDTTTAGLETRTAQPGEGAFAQEAGATGNETNSSNDTNGTLLVAAASEGEMLPLWAWLLLGVALLFCACLVPYLMGWCGGKERKKKGKRSSKKAKRADSEQDTTAESPSSLPASELEMRQPLVQESRAAGVGAAAGGGDLFSLMDRNHDGVVSASEFQQAMTATMPQAMGGVAPQMQMRPQMATAPPTAGPMAGFQQPAMHLQSAAMQSGGMQPLAFPPVPTGSMQSVASAPSGSMMLQAGGTLVPAGAPIPMQSVGAAPVPAGSMRMQAGGHLVPAGTGTFIA